MALTQSAAPCAGTAWALTQSFDSPSLALAQRASNPGSKALAKTASNLAQCLNEALQISGATGVALADWRNGNCLGLAGENPFDLQMAVAGNTEIMRAQLNLMADLDVQDQIEDIFVTLGQQLRLLRPVGRHLFLYLELDKAESNLGLARYQLQGIAAKLAL